MRVSDWDWETKIWQPNVLYAPQGVDLRGGGSSSEKNDTVKGQSQGISVIVKHL